MANYKPRLIIFFVIGFSFLLLFLISPYIPPHPDEYQFVLNAWSILLGKQLQNFTHIAATEYLLAGYYLLLNFITNIYIGFPDNQPNEAAIVYARTFCFVFYFLTCILGYLILQRGKDKPTPASVIFTVLYFSSLGVFERFSRVNSDAISLFFFLNYLLLSSSLRSRKAHLLSFFWLDALFVFLISFTNIKALLLVLPLVLIHLITVYIRHDEKRHLPRLYSTILYVLGIVFVSLLLWIVLIPRPLPQKAFWYNIKATAHTHTEFAIVFPSQAYHSWLFYLYDFFVEYLNIPQTLIVALFLIVVIFLYRKKLRNSLNMRALYTSVKHMRFESNTVPLFTLIFLSYYLGVSSRVIHWSRWGLPLGVIGMLILSLMGEKALLTPRVTTLLKRYAVILIVIVIPLAFVLKIAMTVDIYKSRYSQAHGYSLIYTNLTNYFAVRGITRDKIPLYAAWFRGVSGNVPNIFLDELVESKYRQTKYLLIPYWVVTTAYTQQPVDKSLHNLRAFIHNYADTVEYRYPTLLSRYIHAAKVFAAKNLSLTYSPEIESMVESDYAVVSLKKRDPSRLPLTYTVSENNLYNCYINFSIGSRFKNYLYSPTKEKCYFYIGLYETDVSHDNTIKPLYRHGLLFQFFMKGTYKVSLQNIQDGDIRKVYANAPFKWDQSKHAISLTTNKTLYSVEVGILNSQEHIPNVKYKVEYQP